MFMYEYDLCAYMCLVLVKSKIKSYASTLLLYKKIQFYFS